MKYPRYTREQNLACKLSDADIVSIRRDYETALVTTRALAEKYKVSQTTIMYWVSEDYRTKSCDRSGIRLRDRWRNDPEWRKTEAVKNRKHQKTLRMRKGTAYREWQNPLHRQSYQRCREKILAHHSNYRQENLEKERDRNMQYYYNNKEAISQRRKKAYRKKKGMSVT